MFCKHLNALLTKAAHHYTSRGYTIGVAKGKELIYDYFSQDIEPSSWNNISIILDGIVCVDFDCFTSLGDKYILPPTLKERSPRGLHFFYRLPRGFNYGTSKIKWKDHIDILTKSSEAAVYSKSKLCQGHALCSPSRGYARLSPQSLPFKKDLPMAPFWVLDVLNE